MLHDVVRTLDGDGVYLNAQPWGEPQLGRRGLYAALGGAAHGPQAQEALLWVLNLSDGAHSLLDVAVRSGLPFGAVREAAGRLADAGLLVPTPAPRPRGRAAPPRDAPRPRLRPVRGQPRPPSACPPPDPGRRPHLRPGRRPDARVDAGRGRPRRRRARVGPRRQPVHRVRPGPAGGHDGPRRAPRLGRRRRLAPARRRLFAPVARRAGSGRHVPRLGRRRGGQVLQGRLVGDDGGRQAGPRPRPAATPSPSAPTTRSCPRTTGSSPRRRSRPGSPGPFAT